MMRPHSHPPAQPETPLTYQNRLRVVGRQLDLHDYQGCLITELPSRLVVRAVRRGQLIPELLELPDADMPAARSLARHARGNGERRLRHPVLPTGYEDALRGLGSWLDEQEARWVTLCELPSGLAETGVTSRRTFHSTDFVPLDAFFPAEEIQALLDAAFQRRSAAPKRAFGLGRFRQTG